LGLGLFNLINFIPYEITTVLGLNSLIVELSVVFILVILLTYSLNHHQVNTVLLAGLSLFPEQSENSRKAKQAEEVTQFKARYVKYSNDELETILREKKYVAEALQAAREILNERHQANNTAM
jgi:hypothetical protein